MTHQRRARATRGISSTSTSSSPPRSVEACATILRNLATRHRPYSFAIFESMDARSAVPLLLFCGALLPACPSGETQRGVEHPDTKRPQANASGKCKGHAVDAWAPPGFCVTRFSGDLSRPRHLVFAPNGDLLVATRSGIVVLWDANGDGESDKDER